MRIEILHLDLDRGSNEFDPALSEFDFLIKPTTERAVQYLRANLYERVGVVDTEVVVGQAWDYELFGNHLDCVWDVTQNFDRSWAAHSAVSECADAAVRSSMAGDIFVAGDIPYLVKGVGFECLVPGRDLI